MTRNQVPVAFVVLNGNLQNSDNSEKCLRELCENELDSAYRPIRYYFVKALPLTKIGKIDYRALEQEAAEIMQISR